MDSDWVLCVGTGSAALSRASSGTVQGQDKWLQPCLHQHPSLRPSRWVRAPWVGNAQGIIFPLQPKLYHGGRKEWRQAIRALWARALQPEERRACLSLQAIEYDLMTWDFLLASLHTQKFQLLILWCFVSGCCHTLDRDLLRFGMTCTHSLS